MRRNKPRSWVILRTGTGHESRVEVAGTINDAIIVAQRWAANGWATWVRAVTDGNRTVEVHQ